MTATMDLSMGRVAPFAALFAVGYNIFFLGKIGPCLAADFQVEMTDLTKVFFASQAGLAVGGASLGAIHNRLGRAKTLLLSLLIGATLNAALPFAPDFNTFILLRFAGCIAFGLALPAALSTIAATGRRGADIGIGLACQALGNLAATAATIIVLDHLGWRAGLWGGSLIILCLLPLLNGLSDDIPSSEAPSHGGVAREHHTAVAILALCFIGTIAVTTMLASWGATYFYRYRGIGLTTFASFSTFSVLGNLVGLTLSGFIAQKMPIRRLVPALLCVQAAALVGMGWADFGTFTFVAAIGIGALAQSAGQGVLNATVAWTFPRHEHPAVFGYMTSSARIGGLIGSLGGGLALAQEVPLGWIFITAASICAVTAMTFVLAARLGIIAPREITKPA